MTGAGAGLRASADFWCMGHSGCDDIRKEESEYGVRDTYRRGAAFIEGGGVVVCWRRRRRLVCPKPSHVCDMTSRGTLKIISRPDSRWTNCGIMGICGWVMGVD